GGRARRAGRATQALAGHRVEPAWCRKIEPPRRPAEALPQLDALPPPDARQSFDWGAPRTLREIPRDRREGRVDHRGTKLQDLLVPREDAFGARPAFRRDRLAEGHDVAPGGAAPLRGA